MIEEELKMVFIDDLTKTIKDIQKYYGVSDLDMAKVLHSEGLKYSYLSLESLKVPINLTKELG